MNKIGEKWMAADLYEKCLICDGKGQIFSIHAASKACPECEGIGFMLIGMTVGELDKLNGDIENLKKRVEIVERDRNHFRESRDEWYAIAEERKIKMRELKDTIRQRIYELGEANSRGDFALAALANPPWIPVVGDRVRSKTTGATGTIERVFRGDPVGFRPNTALVNVEFDNGGHAYNFDPREFEPVSSKDER